MCVCVCVCERERERERERETESERGERRREKKKTTDQEHGESLAEDGIKEGLGASARHDEEVTYEEILPAAVVHQGVVQAAEQCLKRILKNINVASAQVILLCSMEPIFLPPFNPPTSPVI